MKILPFYTATGMQDAHQVDAQDPLLCPTWKFLPFQIQRDHLADTYIQEIKLVDCSGNETDVFDYFLGSEEFISDWEQGASPTYNFNPFVDDNNGVILTAVTSDTSLDVCVNVNPFSLATGEAIVFQYDLTLNSGTLPNVLLGNAFAELWSERTQSKAGGDIVYLTATGNNGGNVQVSFRNEAGNDTSFSVTDNSARKTSIALNEFTTYDFITYNGTPLSTTLPYGVYYLKISDGNTTWFSEIFSIENIQPQLIVSWPTESYDTFTTSGADITSAIKVAAASAVARSNTFSARTGEKFIFNYDLTLNSGDIPSVVLYSSDGNMSNSQELTPGLGTVELTATKSAALARFTIFTNPASNFALGSVYGNRKSGEYVHLEYTNARDFNNSDNSIYYVGGFTQQAYLRTYENLPSHESIETGDEKNGEFVAEKMVRKYTRSVVSYESRSMYNAMTLLKHHTTVKILNEVGEEYLPNVGNIDVSIDWDTFDTGSLRISWNELGDVWTNSMDNIS